MDTFSAISERHQSPLGKLVSQNLSSSVSRFTSTTPTAPSRNVFNNQPQRRLKVIAQKQESISVSDQSQNFTHAGNSDFLLEKFNGFLVQNLSSILKQKEDASALHSITSRKKAMEDARRMITHKKRNQHPF